MARSLHFLLACGEAADSYKHIIRWAFLSHGFRGSRTTEDNDPVSMDTSHDLPLNVSSLFEAIGCDPIIRQDLSGFKHLFMATISELYKPQ